MRRRPSRRALRKTGRFDLRASVPDQMGATNPSAAEADEPGGGDQQSRNVESLSVPVLDGPQTLDGLHQHHVGERVPQVLAAVQECQTPFSVDDSVGAASSNMGVSDDARGTPHRTIGVSESREDPDARKVTVRVTKVERRMAVPMYRVREGDEVCPEPDIFDKLSKTLEGHAARLAGEAKEQEGSLRQRVVESLKDFRADHSKLGKCLSEYKTVFKSQRTWTRVVTEIGAAIRVSARTVFRMIEDYEASTGPQGVAIDLDTTAIQGSKLSHLERKQMNARLAIRALLDDIPVNNKAAALA